jgi:ketosteroid isomerase-like protein
LSDEFVEFFATGWAKPKPEGFLDHFRPRFHPEARLEQPTMPTAQGWDQIEARFRELFELFPGYLVTVEDWAARGDVVYIAVTHRADPGSRLGGFASVDRVVLEDGLIRERVAYFDSLETLPAALRSPRAWPRLVRWNLGSFRSR